jgi:hypothetical protein
VAEVMVAAKWWTPRGGLIAVGGLCAAVLAIALLRRSRSARPAASAAVPRPRSAAAERAPAAASPQVKRPAPADDDAWIYEE